MRTSSRVIQFFSLAVVAFFFSAFAGAQTTTGCLAHHPKYVEDVLEVTYDNGCTGVVMGVASKRMPIAS